MKGSNSDSDRLAAGMEGMRRYRVYDFHTEQLIGALRADRSAMDRGGLYGDEWGFGDRLIYVPDAGVRQG